MKTLSLVDCPVSGRNYRHLAALLAVLVLPSCHGASRTVDVERGASMHMSSPSFRDGQIPKDFTCDGANKSPRLEWSEPPAGAKSLALIVSDPDAPIGTFVHWVLYNIPAGKRELDEGVPTQGELTDGSRQGQNDFGETGYGGPCPPRGSTHRYFFELYALDAPLKLPAEATRKQLENAMQGHILARGELIARYGR